MVFDIESPIFALINCHFLPYIKFDEKINAILVISAVFILIKFILKSFFHQIPMKWTNKLTPCLA